MISYACKRMSTLIDKPQDTRILFVLTGSSRVNPGNKTTISLLLSSKSNGWAAIQFMTLLRLRLLFQGVYIHPSQQKGQPDV